VRGSVLPLTRTQGEKIWDEGRRDP
jgi:hypothetical protein